MKLTIRDRLTFGQIADAWASEVTGEAWALDRDEILLELLRSLWRGEFNHAELLAITRGILRDLKMFLLIRDTPHVRLYVLNMFPMRGSRL